MKAVILSRVPSAMIVDITHDVEPFNIKMGALILAGAARYFPDGTIHVAVVDPGVGGSRKPIVVQGNRSLFVGPDNGLLMLAARREGIRHVYEVTNPRCTMGHISSTFHGRDVFAPTAAALASELAPHGCGSELVNYTMPDFVRPTIEKGRVECEILHVDRFGNVITNVPGNELQAAGIGFGGHIRIRVRRRTFQVPVRETYGEVPPKKLVALVGSHDFLEIATNRGNAARKLHAKAEDKVRIFVEQGYQSARVP